MLRPQDKFRFWNKVLVLLASSLKAVIASHTTIVNQSFPIKILFEHVAHKTFNDSFWFWIKPLLQEFRNSGDDNHSKIGFNSPQNTDGEHLHQSYVDVSKIGLSWIYTSCPYHLDKKNVELSGFHLMGQVSYDNILPKLPLLFFLHFPYYVYCIIVIC